MNWREIDGWFDDGDEAMYYNILKSIPDGGNFLEIGCYKGRSTACMANLILATRKNVKIHVIDTFEGDDDCGYGNIYEQFMANMMDYSHLIGSVRRGTSYHMSQDNADYFDAIYIDASHKYKDVLRDIDCWLPFVTFGGCMAGHDYNWSDVHKAVNERFTEITQVGNSWLVFP
jgi:predicted O-methyltransferase YrrM